MKNRAIIFSGEAKIERWTGYDMVEFRFISGDETINILIPDTEALKIAQRLDYLLDERNG